MDPALTLTLFAAPFAAVAAFVGYWSGVAATERRTRDREQDLLAELDAAVDVIAASSTGRHLRLVGGA